MKRKSSGILSVKSREQLIDETINTFQQQRNIRRTKIICSISDKTNNYQCIRDMIENGGDCLNFNVAYSKDKKNALKQIATIRDQLEQDLDRHIPLNLMLQGRQIRVGQLRQPEIFLKEGQVIRLISDKRLIGDQNLISIDDENFFNSVGVGDKIVMDYGQVIVSVLSKENSDKAYKQLSDDFPDIYNKARPSDQNSERSSLTDLDFINDQIPSSQNLQIDENLQEIRSDRKLKLEQALQNKKTKKKLFQVLVCKVQANCLIRPLRPVFLLNQADWLDSPFTPKIQPQFQKNLIKEEQELVNKHSKQEDDDEFNWNEDEEEESQITPQDIIFIKIANHHGYDSITISNIHCSNEIQELRNIIGKDSKLKIIVRITTLRGAENFDELARASDGCMLARAYLAVQSMVECVVQQQINIIKTAHKYFKPILESMTSSMIPTFSEMGDISNLVNEDVDAIMLTGETTYGTYPVQTIATLDRVCRQVESIQRQKRAQSFIKKQHRIIISQKNIIQNCVTQATVDAAYRMQVDLILVTTNTGISAVKLAKLKPPCIIIAITSDYRLARQLQIIGGIRSFVFANLYGSETLFQKVIEKCLKSQIIQKGNLVIQLSGQVENSSGNLNTLKIVQV